MRRCLAFPSSAPPPPPPCRCRALLESFKTHGELGDSTTTAASLGHCRGRERASDLGRQSASGVRRRQLAIRDDGPARGRHRASCGRRARARWRRREREAATVGGARRQETPLRADVRRHYRDHHLRRRRRGRRQFAFLSSVFFFPRPSL